MIVAASNVNLAESNLDRMDPRELVAAVTGNGYHRLNADPGRLT